MKNPCGKTVKVADAYEVWANARLGWFWYVLKKYQMDDSKPYARWYCFVKTPYCPDGEYGDTYVDDVITNGKRIK